MLKGIILFISLSLFSFKKSSLNEYTINGKAQGTTYSIIYYSNSEKVNKSNIDSVFKALDKSLSVYQPNSLISTFNRSSSSIITDKHLETVVKKSLKVYKETKGLFDVTVYPLVNAWGFGSRKITQLPDSSQIKEILPCVGSNKLFFKGNKLVKEMPCLQIDVNGIAQGYSVDVLAKYLQKKGIKNYLVEVGGELRIKGKKPNGELMRIGIESPAEDSFSEPEIRSAVALKKGAITTSGNYRKYIESENKSKRLSHLINPKSGYPIQGSLISVTVIAKKAIDADAYDNALMAMTIDDALSFVKKNRKIEAYFIYAKEDGAVADTLTKGFKKYIVNLD